MKKIFLSLVLSIAATVAVWAQTPQKFNYQGIARNGQGAPLASQSISLRFTILDGGQNGTNVYEETQSATTNTYGLYNTAIGGGTVVSGTMAGIDWSTGNKFIKVELDPTGGTTYTTIGTPQLLSVPYAMYAAAAPAINGTNGGVYYGTGPATPAAFTAAGTTGQVLTSNGVAAPTWTDITPASDVNGAPGHIIKFGTATTGVNSLLNDSTAGLLYNTNTFLDPANSVCDIKLVPNAALGSNWMNIEGSGANSYTYLTVSDSVETGVKGIFLANSQDISSEFTNGNNNNFVLAIEPSIGYTVLGNAFTGFMDMEMTSGNIDMGGDLNVLGNLSKAGGTFKIDDPIDPSNKYLYHSFVESPDMMNIYNGNVTTDANGVAVVTLPEYFDVLNKDFRYQLTVIGTFAQAIIGEKVNNNHFTIKTNQPNVEVSWLVTGVRQDAWANAHRVVPEVAKEAKNKGKYLHAKELGKPATEQITLPKPQLSSKK